VSLFSNPLPSAFVSPRRLLIVALAMMLATMGLVVASSPPAHALCAAQKEEGRWVNTDPNTRSITRAELRFVCKDHTPIPPGPEWYVHLFGKCHPIDCNWGEVGARRLDNDQIYAFYNQGFAKRHVWAKMSKYRAGQLWVFIHTDFTDPSRPDYDSHNWFRRAP
jgi:hypothetical protein